MENQSQESQLVAERALDLFRHTSSSIGAHLEQVEGWLRVARLPKEPDFWRVDAVAGPIGALADAWGRLYLWANGTDTFAELEGELNAVMDRLVELRHRILSGDLGDDEIDILHDLVQRTRAIYQTAVLDRDPGNA